MRDYWFISDTHFFHQNIIKYCDRPFKSVEEMNEKLIDNWNSVVKRGDLVYHLGDVVMGDFSHSHFAHIWSRLNGRKRLIVGNHDDVKYLSAGGFFEKVMLWRAWDDKNLLFSHVPIHEESIHRGRVNIHGHTHNKGSPKGPYKSVCVESINYTPVNLEELA